MENYDAVIIGAGIAGAGLAYHLSRRCPEKSVLIIDRAGIGASAAYEVRNTYKRIVAEYDLGYIKRFKGMKIGTTDETFFTVEHDLYNIDYAETCRHLIKKSRACFMRDNADDVKDGILHTSNGRFRFGHLIDCSGSSFFLKRIMRQPKPFLNWVALAGAFPRAPPDIDRDYIYFQFGEEGFFEDLYPLHNRTLCGYWQYTRKIDHTLIRPTKKTLLRKYFPGQEKRLAEKAVITNAPVFPIVKKNFAFLGDSFGNSFPSSAEGIRPILDSARLLAESIRNNNLQAYQEEWKRRYMGLYMGYLVSRIDRYNNPPLLRLLKKRYPKNIEGLRNCTPDFFMKIMRNERINMKDIKIKFPKYRLFFLLCHYISLKLRYSAMKFA